MISTEHTGLEHGDQQVTKDVLLSSWLWGHTVDSQLSQIWLNWNKVPKTAGFDLSEKFDLL